LTEKLFASKPMANRNFRDVIHRMQQKTEGGIERAKVKQSGRLLCLPTVFIWMEGDRQ